VHADQPQPVPAPTPARAATQAPAQAPVSPAELREQIRQSVTAANQAVRDAAQAEAEAEVQAEARAEARAEANGAAARGERVAVSRDAQGRTVVRTGDRTIVIDPSAVPDADARDALIANAIAPPPPLMPERGIEREMIPLVGIILGCLTLMVLGLPLVRAWVRRFERRPLPAVDGEIGPRLMRIEQAVEAIAIEVERVGEAQRFQSRLLAERAPQAIAEREQAPARVSTTP